MRILGWRIGTDTPDYLADDRTGRGAETSGGRWNRVGSPVLYASSSRALACLETLVHLGRGSASFPLNRYLVEVRVSDEAWAARTLFDPAAHVGWDAEPAGQVSLDWGTAWLRGEETLIAEVPSVIVPEEPNYLINPGAPGMGDVELVKIRKWLYDTRLRAG